MTLKKLFSCIGAIAMLYLHAGELAAQSSDRNEDETLQVVLNYGASTERHLLTHRGVAEAVSLHPNQWLPFTLQFPNSKAGQPVMVGTIDGGKLNAITSQGSIPLADDTQTSFPVSANGTVAFSFQAGETPGLYRITVELPSGQYLLQFYLVNP